MPVHVFDAYGTLLDVHAAVRRLAPRIGPAWEAVSAHTRQRQLEYTWVRTLGGFPWRDFRALTADAFVHALAAHRIPAAPDLLDAFVALYDRLDAFPDAAAALARLRAGGQRAAILSNGTHAMLREAAAHAGLSDALDAVVSVDDVLRFKTAPEVYTHCCRVLRVEPADVAFYSSNRWDVAAAALAGFKPVWVNRSGAPDEYVDLPPTRVVRGLDEIG